jgi:hypothetical protein
MDYRNICRAVLFDKAIAKYNKSAILPLSLTHVQILYGLYWLTRKRPVASAPDIRIQLITFRRSKISLFFVLSQLHAMESAHLVSHQVIERGHFYWNLNIAGHNALKRIERLVRKERSDHRMSTRLMMPADL